MRTHAGVRTLFVLGLWGSAFACSSTDESLGTAPTDPANPPAPTAAVPGSSGAGASSSASSSGGAGSSSSSSSGGAGSSSSSSSSSGASGSSSSSSGAPVDPSKNGVKDNGETDVDCGGPAAPKCAENKDCMADGDCAAAVCNYAGKCVSAPSCKTHLGGDTCGPGEVGAASPGHESCCRTLPVTGFVDPARPGKTVYLDKYEITAGRVRAWIAQVAAANGGVPDVKGWIAAHRPGIWDASWDAFLPSDYDGGTMVIGRRLLGDPRPEDDGTADHPGPGVILPPATDQARHMGVNYQFGSEIYVDLHGNNCATYAGSYGFPTFFYPPDILARDSQRPRPSALGMGVMIAPQDYLDVKSMNCITNAMLAAFCAWDGGQLATDEVLDYVTATPATLGNTAGCGTQYDNHNELLGNIFTHTVQTGGRCAPVNLLNATFDAGDSLPVAGSPLNMHNYHYPDLGDSNSDKSWEIAAPGRASLASPTGEATDAVRINAADEPWMDLNGNVSEAALDTTNGAFTGAFALKYRGIGYGSSRSDLNTTLIRGETVIRLKRPEAKAAYTGGRCMRYR